MDRLDVVKGPLASGSTGCSGVTTQAVTRPIVDRQDACPTVCNLIHNDTVPLSLTRIEYSQTRRKPCLDIVMGMYEGQAAPRTAMVPWSRRRRWTVGVIAALVVLGLVVFVPGPLFRADHLRSAHELVDEVAAGRAELLAEQSEIRSPIENLGTPIRAWDEVSCWLEPRTSDGDGEQGVVVFYWQACALTAYEIYALPPDAGDVTQVAASLRGHVRNDPTCAEPIFDALTPDFGDSRDDEYAAALWWFDPDGTPPDYQPERCTLPSPGDTGTAYLATSVDEPLADGGDYIVFEVRSPIQSVDVGCERWFAWLGTCTDEPEGFPSLS
ncbi:hypothetical protein NW249_18100 [Streptomyces sp. OUCMDZ-4982]|uniref:hypothetical protein n=1 Tax=Streptomyces sp. OUCMDZ-4982 TaxID=2973090 RepID=UPI00215BA7D2|nr:hypothetical protein [Streptomyces sp. OUCMDZ-4982]MCR8944040.1 hypothetical protein [Streptomyces sp. OUCMDZ-4982]